MAKQAISKTALREQARQRRSAKQDKDGASEAIMHRLLRMPEYSNADLVLWYLHIGDEVRTEATVRTLLEKGTSIAVPYCVDKHLELFRCTAMSDLAVGRFNILEPRAGLRSVPERLVRPAEVDAIIIPGLAFDRSGGRLGYGRGFYDRCLAATRPDATRIALAYDCQLFQSVPTDPHDVPMDWIATETAMIRCGTDSV